jgi:hypothetical protein
MTITGSLIVQQLPLIGNGGSIGQTEVLIPGPSYVPPLPTYGAGLEAMPHHDFKWTDASHDFHLA